MTNRLLDRSPQATVSQHQQVITTREQRAPRLLIVGLIGFIGVVGLGLLAVPMLIGTDMFFAARAGCLFTPGIWQFDPPHWPHTGLPPSIPQSTALDINYPVD